MTDYFTQEINGIKRRYHVMPLESEIDGVVDFKLIEEILLNGSWLPGKIIGTARRAREAKNHAETMQSMADAEQGRATAWAWFATTFD